jgi:REP element-mobilizing transposase RayT
MLPREVVPGATWLITRRCLERRFFTRPSAIVNQIVTFCMAVAAVRAGLQVHAYCVMSNHWHLVITDPDGRLPDFLHWFHLHLSKALNCHLGRRDSLVECGETSYVRLVDAEDVLDKIVYTLSNPVAAGLVERGIEWPGVRSRPEQYGEVVEASRPPVYFSPSGATPEVASLELVPPAGFGHLELAEVRRRVREAVESREAELRAEWRGAGREFLGARRVREQSPLETPQTAEDLGGLRPRIAAKWKWSRIEAIQRLQAYWKAYRAALVEYLRGRRDVVFPGGTYLKRLRDGVRCEPFPDYRVRPAPS